MVSLQRPAARPRVGLERSCSVSSPPCPYRELLRCEAALARLYCRLALLSIFAPKLPHLFTRLFHIRAIRDITLEHLQLLSNQLLAPPLPGKPWLRCWHGRRQQRGGEGLRGSRAPCRLVLRVTVVHMGGPGAEGSLGRKNHDGLGSAFPSLEMEVHH